MLGLIVMAIVAATPAPPVTSLTYFTGAWSCAGEFPRSGKKISSHMTFSLDSGGFSLVKHHDDDPPNGYHAIELWGYSETNKRYEAALQDPYSGVREFVSNGFDGDTLAWTSASWLQPVQSFVYHRNDPQHFTVDYHVATKTGDVVVDTLLCTRLPQ